MSIFIGNLAFAGSTQLLESAKIGILTGSVIAGISGCLVLRWSGKPVDTTSWKSVVDFVHI